MAIIKLNEGDKIPWTVFYNANNACRNRGMEDDEPSKTFAGSSDTTEAAVVSILEESGAFSDEDDVKDYFDGKIPTPEEALEYLDNVDITGGDVIVFEFTIDGKSYKTSWDPEEFANAEKGDEDEDEWEAKKKNEGSGGGWENWEEVTGLEDTLEKIERLAYELRNCVRGAYTRKNTWKELGDHIKELGEDLSEAGENATYMEEDE